MKILLVNKFFCVKGGTETYFFGLTQLLKKRGHDVVHFSMQDDNNEYSMYSKYFVNKVDFNKKMGPFKLLRTACKMLYSFEAKKKFEQLIEDEKPDVIHLNLFQSHLTASIVDAAARHNIPLVYTVHDLKCICPNYKMMNHGRECSKCISGNYWNCFISGCMKDSKLKSLLATFEAYVYKLKKTYQKIDLFITPSGFYRNKVMEAKITDSPIVHIPNFLPVNTNYCVSHRGKYVLYPGRLSKEKGIFTLIEAYSMSNVDIPLYIVGDGPIRKDIETFIREKGVCDRVKLLGFKSGEEYEEILINSFCVCLPSEWNENGPYSIMEAMAVGKPTIVTNLGGLREIVSDGVNGLVVHAFSPNELKSALEKLYFMTDSQYDIMAVNALKKAKEMFDSSAYVDRLEEIYKSVM